MGQGEGRRGETEKCTETGRDRRRHTIRKRESLLNKRPIRYHSLDDITACSCTCLHMPIAPGGAQAIYDPSPAHSVLGCSRHSGPVGPLLFQLCFNVSLPAVATPASLPPPLCVPGQGLACGAGCWLPEGVSDPAPLPPQYLFGHWFLSCSLPHIFISDLLLPSDFVDAPQQTDVEECLDLFLHCLCCPPCLTSVQQDSLHIGVEDAKFGSHADSSRCPDVFEHDKSCSCLANSGCDISVCTSLLINHAG